MSRAPLSALALFLAVTAPAFAQTPAMPWQRSLADTQALVQRTGRPLLICVNADGEPASEQLARSRYTDPEFVRLAAGFVCVLASPNRHDDRDHDDAGNRVVDPKFGRVTCSEHVDIEPMLYERYFDGQRVAPRHVGVAPDGTILFDIFLSQSLQPIEDALRQHGRPDGNGATAAGDAFASPDAADRTRLEDEFRAGDETVQLRLIAAALDPGRSVQHPEIVRMALRAEHGAVRAAAGERAADHPHLLPDDLWPEALRVTWPDRATSRRLANGLAELADDEQESEARRKQARTLALTFPGLLEGSPSLDASQWSMAMDTTPAVATTAEEVTALEQRLDELESGLRQDRSPARLLDYAAATMDYAFARLAQGSDPRFLFQDASAVASQVAQDTTDPEIAAHAQAYVAWANYQLGDPVDDAAIAAAEHLRSLGDVRATGVVLELIAAARTRAIYDALGKDEPWSSSWLADVDAAYRILGRHPNGTPTHAVAHIDFLDGMWAWGAARDAALTWLARYPGDATLHERLRALCLRDGGARALARVYGEPAPEGADDATWEWFRGLAYVNAAERDVSQGAGDGSVELYRRAAASFAAARAAKPEFTASSDHYECLARSGAAYLLLRAGEVAAALETMVPATRLTAANFDAMDGLGRTPRTVARSLLAAVRTAGLDGGDELREVVGQPR